MSLNKTEPCIVIAALSADEVAVSTLMAYVNSRPRLFQSFDVDGERVLVDCRKRSTLRFVSSLERVTNCSLFVYSSPLSDRRHFSFDGLTAVSRSPVPIVDSKTGDIDLPYHLLAISSKVAKFDDSLFRLLDSFATCREDYLPRVLFKRHGMVVARWRRGKSLESEQKVGEVVKRQDVIDIPSDVTSEELALVVASLGC